MDPRVIKSNLEEIEKLPIASYEREVIKSAFYNHINKTPISEQAIKILNKYGLGFSEKGLGAATSELANRTRPSAPRWSRGGRTYTARSSKVSQPISTEERKMGYKRSYTPTARPAPKHETRENGGIYGKDYINREEENAQISLILRKSNEIKIDAQRLLSQCEENLKKCFKPGELSYTRTQGLINSMKAALENNAKALNELLVPFLHLFGSLQEGAQEKILGQAKPLVQALQELQELSGNLCVRLSAIPAHQRLRQDKGLNEYLSQDIERMEAYLKH